jgi:NAD(P)-dependent dehydrogenase (short-subunit alcohol dehydrogenase family)
MSMEQFIENEVKSNDKRFANQAESFGGRTVVITGGTSGIGLATAREVIGRGGNVILMGRTSERLTAARKALGSTASTVQVDVTDEDALKTAFANIDRIDHLVTAAAGTLRGRVVDLDTRHARQLFESKFWGQHHCLKYAAPRMAADGSVVLFSGWVSRKPAVEMSTLAAINSATEALARTMALELAPVRVNAITPGQIDTPLWRSRLSETEVRAHFDRVASALPVGRVGTADDVAHAVLFLMTNGFMTGAVLDIDGGWR